MERNHICKKCGGIAGWDSYFQSWICTRCGNEEPKPITKADRIRSMTDEEMADWLFQRQRMTDIIVAFCLGLFAGAFLMILFLSFTGDL